MGNNNVNNNVHNAVKEQADHFAYPLYKYVDVTGKGIMVELMRKCMKTNDYREIDKMIMEEIKPFLYNDGDGCKVPITELMRSRIEERPPNRRVRMKSNGDAKSPVRLRRNNVLPMIDVIQADEYGYYVPSKTDSGFREVCWDISKRGAAGETILHFCYLNTSRTHYELGKRLVTAFPKMVNDYYLSDEYYGETVLHMAISNEDPATVKFLLDSGAHVHQRCCGKFFTPEDQKNTRSDSLQQEFVEVALETNYEGQVYWGEYPLSFAACCAQEEIVRLLIAKGADPNMQDNNGNTTLHMLVIRAPRMESKRVVVHFFDLLVDKGARLDIKNRQGLTPLTLSAKLARHEMYAHIQELEKEVHWRYGRIVSAAYPLNDVDTISPDGSINQNSVLMLVVCGEQAKHLNMIEGLLSHLLDEKWNTYVRRRFWSMAIIFFFYFLCFLGATLCRPGRHRDPAISSSFDPVTNTTTNTTLADPCYLLRVQDDYDYLRFICETLLLFGATFWIVVAIREIFYQGFSLFLSTLLNAPTRVSFLLSCTMVLVMVPFRATCSSDAEDVVWIFSILLTTPYFLFFFRGVKIVGPFVLMIFKMVQGDLFRFFIIYAIYLIGFSQAMFLVFRKVENSLFQNPAEALMGMFIMSLGEFSDIYEQFDCSKHSSLGKGLFMLYMILVTLLLVNMLIAMMGNTYTLVNETQTEYLRQWAKICLVVEQSFSSEERKFQQIRYTQPLKDGRRALLVNRIVEEEESSSDEEEEVEQEEED